MKLINLPLMLLSERLPGTELPRTPEPTALMDDDSQVEGFHEAGTSVLTPVYEFNAWHTSQLAPEGGTVLDLGSGSGRYLAYLARRRPDLHIIGLELAPAMIKVGQAYLASQGLAQRVELRAGDMTAFCESTADRIDVVSSVFSLHHLPTAALLRRCMAEVRRLVGRDGAAFWVFDHVRPRKAGTLQAFPRIFTPSAPAAFNLDSSHSLAAAFSFQEMVDAMTDADLTGAEHLCARWMRLYQIHRLVGRAAPSGAARWNSADELNAGSRSEANGLASLFPGLAAGPWRAR